MSEYLNKKAVLEYTKKKNAAIFFDFESYHDLRNAVLSGAFDAEPDAWKPITEFAYRVSDELDREVKRLRAALERIKKWADDPEPGTMYKIWNLANETLKGDENDA